MEHKLTTPEEVAQARYRAESALCASDKQYLFERHYVIKPLAGDLQLMSPLRRGQRKLIALLNHLRREQKPAWVIIGKARKQGFSSLVAADCLDEVVHRGVDALLIANERDLADYIYDIIRRYYHWLDQSFQPHIPALTKPKVPGGAPSRRELRFLTAEGKIEVETANNVLAGTGRTPQYILASEASKWESGAQTAVSLFQAISYRAGTTFIVESTFYGHDSLFLPMWEKAYSNCRLSFSVDAKNNYIPNIEVTNQALWNGFVPLFISVLDDDEACLPFPDESYRATFLTGIDPEEKLLLDERRATPEFLQWRRRQIPLTCQGRLEVFHQEYPTSPAEAVIAKGKCFFSPEKLNGQPAAQPDPPKGLVGRLEEPRERWMSKVGFVKDSQGSLTRYREPTRAHRYILGVDPAEGRSDSLGKDLDWNLIQVLDLDANREQVAKYRSREHVSMMTDKIVALARYYNDAFVVLESNSFGLHLCIEVPKLYSEERLYHERDAVGGHGRSIGFRTTNTTRPLILSKLRDAVNDDNTVINDLDTLKEFQRFVTKGGRPEAEDGYHDDEVMAYALAIEGAMIYPLIRSQSQLNELPEHLRKRPSGLIVKQSGRDGITGY